MRTVILYHPKSDHGGLVEDFVHEYQRFKGRKVELLSLETRDGSATATLYDITSYPAVLVLANDGGAQKIWQGVPLPMMSEIDAYSFNSEDIFAGAQLLAA